MVAKAASVLSGSLSFTGFSTAALLDLGGFDQFVSNLTGTNSNARILNNGATAATLTVSTGTVIGGVSTFAGDIQDGAGTLSLSLSTGIVDGTLILTGDNSYSGTTFISLGDTLQIGNGGSSGKIGTGDITNNGSLIFNKSANAVVEGGISGSGSLTKAGTGTVILDGAASYSGATIINNGKLLARGQDVLSANSAVTVNGGGTLDIGGFSQTIRSLTGSGVVTNSGSGEDALSINLTLGASSTFSGTLVNSGTGILGLTKLGTGTLTLTGPTPIPAPPPCWAAC